MSSAVAVYVPQANPNDDAAVLVVWHVETGAQVEADATLATLETTKAAFDVHAPCGGYVHFSAPVRSALRVGAAFAWVSQSAAPPAELERTPPETRMHDGAPTADPGVPSAGDERFSRKALRLLREAGIDPATVPTGTTRASQADVEAWLADRAAPVRPVERPTETDELEQSPAKLAEGRLLAATYRDAVPSSVALPVSEERVGARLRSLAAEHGPVSLLELVVHECAALLGDYPPLNGCHVDGRAWRYRHAGIGVALNFGRGLRVPVIRDADRLSLLDLVHRMRDLTLRYARGELSTQDVVGGTFTVTDLSSLGVVHFVPVLNHRQSAILGICAERPGTAHRDLVLTFDHRMSDGGEAAAFLGALRDRVEGATGGTG